jgi:hypothetical protein
MDRDDGVLLVHLAAEHRADFTRLDVTAERFQAALEVARDVLALAGPVDEDAEVVRLPAQRLGQRAVVLDLAAALQDLLRVGLVLPEIRRRDGRLDLGQLALQPRFVKAPSADQRRGTRGRRSCGRVRRGS